MEQNRAIRVEKLRAGYGKKTILHDMTFAITSGQWCVLLGPNGSGKSTLMKTLMGMLISSGGEAAILGLECFKERREVKKRVGYVSEEPYLYSNLNAVQHLRFAGDMHCVPKKELIERIERLLDFFDLKDAARQRLSEYSMGMKRKVELSMALIHNPRVLILDEPLNGLDPITAKTCRVLLRDLCDREDKTILMSTHNLGMMHDYCDRLIVISNGAILANDSPADLCEKYPGQSIEEIFLDLVGVSLDDKKLTLSQPEEL
ncbi:MAG: ABC transporter ATP-binding protein [Desulfobacteraceae bacterium]|nr:ABC transporter ATP-binding protein [Desulfobacteraceae bacterium]